MTLGEKVRLLRRARGWSQAELAEKAGIISKQTISFIELNVYKTPGMDKLQKIAVALEINPKELFILAGLPTSPETQNDVILRELEDIDVKLRDLMAKLRQ